MKKLTQSIADRGAQLFCPITVWLIEYAYHQEYIDVLRYRKETSTPFDRCPRKGFRKINLAIIGQNNCALLSAML